jgi:hypothetical protein
MRRVAALLIVLACTSEPVQLPLGGDRECSWSPDIALHCCTEHDLSYWVGGQELDRLYADRELYWCLVAAGIPKPVSRTYFFAVRHFAAGSWRYSSKRTRSGYFPKDPNEDLTHEERLELLR